MGVLQSLFLQGDMVAGSPDFAEEYIVGDPVKPGSEFGFALEFAQGPVGANKGDLGQIVGQSIVSIGEPPMQPANRRLVTADKFIESVAVIILQNPVNKIRICEGKGHLQSSPLVVYVEIADFGRDPFLFVILPQFPHNQVAQAEEERQESQPP